MQAPQGSLTCKQVKGRSSLVGIRLRLRLVATVLGASVWMEVWWICKSQDQKNIKTPNCLCHLELAHHGGIEAGVQLWSGEATAPHLAPYRQAWHSKRLELILKSPEGLVDMSKSKIRLVLLHVGVGGQAIGEERHIGSE